MLAEAIYTRLATDAGVTALAGNRIYPLVIPERDYADVTRSPCLVYQQTGADSFSTFCEYGRLQVAEYQIDAYAPTFKAAQELGIAARAALENYSGELGSPASVLISRVERMFARDLLDVTPGLFRSLQIFEISYEDV